MMEALFKWHFPLHYKEKVQYKSFSLPLLCSGNQWVSNVKRHNKAKDWEKGRDLLLLVASRRTPGLFPKAVSPLTAKLGKFLGLSIHAYSWRAWEQSPSFSWMKSQGLEKVTIIPQVPVCSSWALLIFTTGSWVFATDFFAIAKILLPDNSCLFLHSLFL